MTETHLTKAKNHILTYDKWEYINKYIKTKNMKIDIGSEITCYHFPNKQVIKFFEDIDPTLKLLIDDKKYGNNTFIFVNEIITYCNKIIAYTMKYINGFNLDNFEAINLFYKLSYDILFEYLTILLNDCKLLSNYGIEVFDCHKTNIILSQTGFKQIDCVDFIEKDIDPKEIDKKNIYLMCHTIYECLIAPYLSTFITNNNLDSEEFKRNPLEFIQKLKTISQNYSDSEIITLSDTKKLARKK